MSKPTLEQYTFFERLRKRSLYKEALKAHNISVIKSFIAAGGDPLKHPDLSAEYLWLIGEYGDGLFEEYKKDSGLETERDTGMPGFNLIAEDDTVKEFEA